MRTAVIASLIVLCAFFYACSDAPPVKQEASVPPVPQDLQISAAAPAKPESVTEAAASLMPTPPPPEPLRSKAPSGEQTRVPEAKNPAPLPEKRRSAPLAVPLPQSVVRTPINQRWMQYPLPETPEMPVQARSAPQKQAAAQANVETVKVPPQEGTQKERSRERTPAAPAPDYLAFSPMPLPAIHAMQGVGGSAISKSQGDRISSLGPLEQGAIISTFKAAYQEALLRDLPLQGALGADVIHGWPPAKPLAWSQNWRSTETGNNSWNLPGLVLAVLSLNGKRAYPIRGLILDHYGKNEGLGGMNGVSGYGAPVTHEFRYGAGIAQRFEKGIIFINTQGKSAFIPEEPPTLLRYMPPEVGRYEGAFPPRELISVNDLQNLFRLAWKEAMDHDSPLLFPDNPVRYAGFSDPALNISGEQAHPIPVRGLYYQTFNHESAALILVYSNEQLFFPHLIAWPPFGVDLNKTFPVSGAEHLADAGLHLDEEQSDISTALVKALIQTFSLYGVPLSDLVPRQDAQSKTWYSAQRFSRGWLYRKE
ncbi:hypothetical protein ACYULU_03355 [Breznakiellaceae bacterium SP9]